MIKILKQSAAEYINSLLDLHHGIGLGDNHAEDADKRWLAEQLPFIKADILFLEQNKYQNRNGTSQDVQPLIEQFLRDPHNADCRAQLRQCVENLHHSDAGESYFALIEAAAACGKQVVFINREGTIKDRNAFMADMVRQHTTHGESYLLLAGKAHLGERGLGDAKGSVSKRLSIPALDFVGAFHPAPNNPKIYLEAFCVFQQPSSNFDGSINLFPYQPLQEQTLPLPTLEQNPPNEEEKHTASQQRFSHRSMLEARKGGYDSVEKRITGILKKATGFKAAAAVGNFTAALDSLKKAQNNDPLTRDENER